MSGFYQDSDLLDYPEAERLVLQAIRSGQRPRTTSVKILRKSDYPNNHHNRKRVHDTLDRLCEATEENWAGRKVFEIPNEVGNQ